MFMVPFFYFDGSVGDHTSGVTALNKRSKHNVESTISNSEKIKKEGREVAEPISTD